MKFGNKIRHTAIKRVLWAVMSISGIRISLRHKEWGAFGFCLLLHEYTGQGKILKGRHMCANFSASKGVRKKFVFFL